MQALIDIREAELTADHAPKNAMERMILGEMARAGVQAEVNHARVLAHTELMRETVDDWWEDDRRQAANNLAARLAKDPGRVAQRLENSLHGALWCLEQWRGLGASAAANGGLTEPQRQLMCDLMGISPLLRDNAARVPAADDHEKLVAHVAGEVKRLETRIELVLRRRDLIARAKVQEGLNAPQDPESRNHRSNESRAHKRLVWATNTFNDLRRGLAPATILDPETGRPLQAAAPASAQECPQPQPPPAPPPAAAPNPDPPPASPYETPIPLPEDASDEDKEMLLLVSATLRSILQAGVQQPNPSAPGNGCPQDG
jgi:hypothetical protein